MLRRYLGPHRPLLHRRAVGGAVIRLHDQRHDSDTEQLYFTVAEAEAADISRAVEAARDAFDNGPLAATYPF
jgi:acyl-CoA reductase-like NAD-dependent aldehyde dehydrogenase